jgi:PIN domain nuclease of toxin-antitoxin system
MLKAIADTHTVIWYLFEDDRLSQTAKSTIENIANNGDYVGFSSITIVEIIYLIEKGRVPSETLTKLMRETTQNDTVLLSIDLDENIARNLSNVSRNEVPDLPDRLIASTALFYNVPIISRDYKIKCSSVQTIW